MRYTWKQVKIAAAIQSPTLEATDEDKKLDQTEHAPRRVLLYHISAMLNVNMCQLLYINLCLLSQEA